MKRLQLKYLLALLTPVFSVGVGMGQDSLSVLRKAFLNGQSENLHSASVAVNPALRPLSSRYSQGVGYVGAFHRHGTRMAEEFDPDNGNTTWTIGADAIMKGAVSAVWGQASYTSGKYLNRQLCLSSDYQVVYPYVNATLTGGDLYHERYCFGGGWSGELRSNWKLGAWLSFDAGHAYRRIDPRPRNITSDLRIAVGTAFAIGGRNLVGVALNLRRYSQSNSTLFRSEMGEETIYHLTGLGTQYKRFAGLGSKMAYTGYEPGVGVQFLHSGVDEFVVAGRYSHLHMRCVLTALNHLPMAAIEEDVCSLSLGWRHSGKWGGLISMETKGRSGNENIFGDPMSGIYPVLTTEKMYSDQRRECLLQLLYELKYSRGYLRIIPGVAYSSRHEKYDAGTRSLQIDRLRASATLRTARFFGSRLTGELSLSAACYIPVNSRLKLPPLDALSPEITYALLAQQYSLYKAQSKPFQTMNAMMKLRREISRKFAIGLSLSWDYAHSSVGENFNRIAANIEFVF